MTGKFTSLLRRSVPTLVVLLLVAAARPELAFGSSLGTADARQHMKFLEKLYQLGVGTLPLLSLLAIVGGILMYGIGGGSEGMMKKMGLPIACFGLASLVLTSGSFLGIGAAVL